MHVSGIHHLQRQHPLELRTVNCILHQSTHIKACTTVWLVFLVMKPCVAEIPPTLWATGGLSSVSIKLPISLPFPQASEPTTVDPSRANTVFTKPYIGPDESLQQCDPSETGPTVFLFRLTHIWVGYRVVGNGKSQLSLCLYVFEYAPCNASATVGPAAEMKTFAAGHRRNQDNQETTKQTQESDSQRPLLAMFTLSHTCDKTFKNTTANTIEQHRLFMFHPRVPKLRLLSAVAIS